MADHPITPTPELVREWADIWHKAKVKHVTECEFVATQAARWGADQELEACCEWVSQFNYDDYSYQERLRAARRCSKPPSLKEQALAALGRLNSGALCANPVTDKEAIRRALEALPE